MDIKKKKCLISFGAVFLSSLIMAFATKKFSSASRDFIRRIYGNRNNDRYDCWTNRAQYTYFNWLIVFKYPSSFILCKKISPRFVFFSLLQVGLTSLFLPLMPQVPLFDDKILNVIFGGFMFGGSIVIALKGNASSGGTDFIALYVSNKSGKEIWNQVFIFNTIMLCVFGYIFGFEAAGYSILFQFMSTKTVSNFHTRYKRVMMQIFTKNKDDVMAIYCKKFSSWDYSFRWNGWIF